MPRPLTTIKMHRRQRLGLALLEFVLWLPVFVLVSALIVNLGTMQTWRLRGEIAARNATWNARWPHRNLTMTPTLRTWRGVTSTLEEVPQPGELAPPELEHPVVHGPLDGVTVLPLFETDRWPVLVGHGNVQRRMPLLRGETPYDSGDIRHPLLDGTWTVAQMSLPANDGRHTKYLYIFPVGSPPGGAP